MKQRVLTTVRSGGAAMTWPEIARALGYDDPEGRGKKAVYKCYQSAMKKISRRSRAIEGLRALVEFRNAHRPIQRDWDAR